MLQTCLSLLLVWGMLGVIEPTASYHSHTNNLIALDSNNAIEKLLHVQNNFSQNLVSRTIPGKPSSKKKPVTSENKRREELEQRRKQEKEQKRLEEQRALEKHKKREEKWRKQKVPVGPNDIVLGRYAGNWVGAKFFKNVFGGKTVLDIKQNPMRASDAHQQSFRVIKLAQQRGWQIHFTLDGMQDVPNILKNKGEHKNKLPSQELRYIRKHWDLFKVKPKFYDKNAKQIPPPWMPKP